jgi:hypothetical protein
MQAKLAARTLHMKHRYSRHGHSTLARRAQHVCSSLPQPWWTSLRCREKRLERSEGVWSVLLPPPAAALLHVRVTGRGRVCCGVVFVSAACALSATDAQQVGDQAHGEKDACGRARERGAQPERRGSIKSFLGRVSDLGRWRQETWYAMADASSTRLAFRASSLPCVGCVGQRAAQGAAGRKQDAKLTPDDVWPHPCLSSRSYLW